jgi:TPR repeat protein
MAIRTMIRGLVEKRDAARRSRAGLVFGTAILLASSMAAADYAAGLSAFNRKEYARAFSEWVESAKAGDAHAQHGLGMLYELGQGVPYPDAKAAADWYQKAAAQNYAPALNNLARLYADGRGVERDVPKAIELWSKAAEAGNVTAHFNLGLQYASGSGVAKDMKKATEHMLQAAESGLPEAQYALATYYRDGTGVEKDLGAARLWYERAASAGFAPARTELVALDKAESPTAAAQGGAAVPAQNQPAQVQTTETPPQPQGTDGTAAQPPAAVQPAEQIPTASQQAATSPSQEPKQPEASPQPAEPTPSPTAPAEQSAAAATNPPAEPEQPQESAPEGPGSEGLAADAQEQQSDLPVAESLTGGARVYRIWLYTSGQEGDARSYWDKLTIQYPRLLKELQLDVRRYFLGEAKGSLYRVFAGPFDDLAAAQKACEDIKQRSSNQFCRPVLN